MGGGFPAWAPVGPGLTRPHAGIVRPAPYYVGVGARCIARILSGRAAALTTAIAPSVPDRDAALAHAHAHAYARARAHARALHCGRPWAGLAKRGFGIAPSSPVSRDARWRPHADPDATAGALVCPIPPPSPSTSHPVIDDAMEWCPSLPRRVGIAPQLRACVRACSSRLCARSAPTPAGRRVACVPLSRGI